MNDPRAAGLQRDSALSVFGEILVGCEGVCEGLLAAVFFDDEGETIDYYSYLDPFDTKLHAAYYGVIMSQGHARARWLGLGDLDIMLLFSERVDSIILSLGEGFGLTLIATAGSFGESTADDLGEVIERLRVEAGIVP